MPAIEIEYPDGRRVDAPLSRTTPLAIGAQSFNDIHLPGDDIGALHCRIGWNKSGYEVTAATARGVELNGTVIEHAFLKPGDVLRIGPYDLTYRADPEPEKPAAKPDKEKKSKEDRKGRGAGTAKAEPAPAKPDEPHESSMFEGPVYAESLPELSMSDMVAASDPELEAFADAKPKPPPPEPQGMVGQIGRELQGGRKRPGEQEILKSPFILATIGGSVALLLIAGTLWFQMGREASSRLYASAESDLAGAKYTQAIEQFEKFATLYPGSAQAVTARVSIAKAKVQKELSGATPAWGLAWERLQSLIREFRNTDSYADLQAPIRQYAEEIALGAAQTAEQIKDETLLPISAEAAQLVERSATEEAPADAFLARVQEATLRANAAIAQQKTRDAAVALLQAELAAKRPIEALAAREGLLRKFPVYRRDKQVEEGLQQALKLEVSAVTVAELDVPALTDPPAAEPRSVLPTFLARSRTTDTSLGRFVSLLAQDSCYAIDTMTGETAWRQVLGFEPPFAPVETRGDVVGWLMFDRHKNELLHLRADTGATIWRQPLDAVPVAAPLVDEGQVYLTLASRKLVRLDAETGKLSAALTFSQPLAGPPVLNSTRQYLFVPGERGLIYALTKRPLACATVTFTDHAPGSIQAPLLAMGRLLLYAENDRASSARLRLFNAANPAAPLPDELVQRVDGLVFDAPTLRGPHLVVPLQGERLAAFVVNDAAGRSELTPVGVYRVQDGYQGPLHVMLGPDQQFWLSSTAFRRFEIATDSIRMDPNFVAVGLTAQPLQLVREQFFVGRRGRAMEGVQLTNHDRQSLAGTWRTMIGGRPRAVAVGPQGNVVAATESGLILNVGSSRLTAGGIERSSVVDLEWPTDLPESALIGTLSDGRLTMTIGGKTPKLWLVEPGGRVVAPIELPAPLQQPPVDLAAGLMLPVAGKLLLRPNTGGPKVEPWQAPVEVELSPKWTHLIRTAEDEFLAIDAEGTCRRMKLRLGDAPHLAEVAVVTLEALPTLPLLSTGDAVILCDAERRVRKLDPAALEPQAEWTAPAELTGAAWRDDRLYVWDRETLRSLEGANLQEVWAQPLDGRQPIGTPVRVGDELWFVAAGGEVWSCDPASGAVRHTTALPQALSLGLVRVGDDLWGVACDGTLWQVPRPAGEAAP
jgi:hypothetical protein